MNFENFFGDPLRPLRIGTVDQKSWFGHFGPCNPYRPYIILVLLTNPKYDIPPTLDLNKTHSWVGPKSWSGSVASAVWEISTKHGREISSIVNLYVHANIGTDRLNTCRDVKNGSELWVLLIGNQPWVLWDFWRRIRVSHAKIPQEPLLYGQFFH